MRIAAATALRRRIVLAGHAPALHNGSLQSPLYAPSFGATSGLVARRNASVVRFAVRALSSETSPNAEPVKNANTREPAPPLRRRSRGGSFSASFNGARHQESSGTPVVMTEEAKLASKKQTEEEVLASLIAARTIAIAPTPATTVKALPVLEAPEDKRKSDKSPMPPVNGQYQPKKKPTNETAPVKEAASTLTATSTGPVQQRKNVATSVVLPKAKEEQQLETALAVTAASAAMESTFTIKPMKGASQSIAVVPTDPTKLMNIANTLEQIESLQSSLPSVTEVGAMIAQLRGESFSKGQTLFDRYRIFGNPFLDEKFLTPGVLACCSAEEPEKGLAIVRDMLNQGRKVEEATLRALFDACDATGAAREAIDLWELMERAGVKLVLEDFDRLLAVCQRREHLDGAVKVLKILRLHRAIPVPTYVHWLRQASIVWRVDAFFDLLMEMRLAGVELEIPSLTSLQSGRMDRALTVMEGVRAVGLDPCYAMSAVYSSMAAQLHRWDSRAINANAIGRARRRFGELKPFIIDWPVRPIPQVLETQAAGLILEEETFKRLKYRQVQDIDLLLQWLPITANITINLRKQLQRMSLLVNTHRVKREIPDIASEYKQGKTLIELSSVHNYPPVSLMRLILRQRGLNALEVRQALANPTEHVTKRDQAELRKAAEYDSIHRSDPFIGAPTYNSDSLEVTVGHFLGARGIRFKTERELGDEQVARFGRRIISPDILLLDPVLINGTPIRWIDAKNYYGAHIVSKRLISRQLSSYVKEWGPGAIVFGMGFSDMFELPGVMCLDTTPFPKTRMGKAKERTKALFYTVVNAFSWKKHLGSELRSKPPTSYGDRSHSKPNARTNPSPPASADAVDDDEDDSSDEEPTPLVEEPKELQRR